MAFTIETISRKRNEGRTISRSWPGHVATDCIIVRTRLLFMQLELTTRTHGGGKHTISRIRMGHFISAWRRPKMNQILAHNLSLHQTYQWYHGGPPFQTTVPNCCEHHYRCLYRSRTHLGTEV